MTIGIQHSMCSGGMTYLALLLFGVELELRVVDVLMPVEVVVQRPRLGVNGLGRLLGLGLGLLGGLLPTARPL